MFLVQLFIVMTIIITDEQLFNINLRIKCGSLRKLCYRGIPDYSVLSQNEISDSESVSVSETITESLIDTQSDNSCENEQENEHHSFTSMSEDDFEFVDKIKYQ